MVVQMNPQKASKYEYDDDFMLLCNKSNFFNAYYFLYCLWLCNICCKAAMKGKQWICFEPLRFAQLHNHLPYIKKDYLFKIEDYHITIAMMNEPENNS